MKVNLVDVISVLDHADQAAVPAGSPPREEALLLAVQATGTHHDLATLSAAIAKHLAPSSGDVPRESSPVTRFNFGWRRPINIEQVNRRRGYWRGRIGNLIFRDVAYVVGVFGLAALGFVSSAVAALPLSHGLLATIAGAIVGGLTCFFAEKCIEKLWNDFHDCHPYLLAPSDMDRYVNCPRTRHYLLAISKSAIPQVLQGDSTRLAVLFRNEQQQSQYRESQQKKQAQLDQQSQWLAQL